VHTVRGSNSSFGLPRRVYSADGDDGKRTSEHQCRILAIGAGSAESENVRFSSYV